MMKRLCVLLLALLILLTATASAFASTKYTHRDDGKDVPVYNDAGEKIFTIPNHKAVETHHKSYGKRTVTYKGKTGWTYDYYLFSEKPRSSSSSKSESKNSKSQSSSANEVQTNVFSGMKSVKHYDVTVRPNTLTGYVNLRWAPSKSAAIHGVRYYGDTLRVIAENKTWAQVVDDSTNECGFMMKNYLERK